MPLSSLERKIFFLLHGFNLPGINQVMVFLSGFGPWLPLAAILFWKVWRNVARQDFFRLVILCLLLLALVDTSTSYFFKNLIQRLRPCKMDELKPLIAQFGQGCGGKWGFFSSHAANAAALVHFLLAFARPKKWFVRTTWLMVGLVGYSRVYLGVHLPLDIIIGSAWGLLLASAWRWVGRMSIKGRVAL